MRFRSKQPMESMYDDSNAEFVSDVIAFRAVSEPMLIREIREVARSDTNTALRGMFQFGGTYAMIVSGKRFHWKGNEQYLTLARALWKGTPPSRAKDHSWREPVAISLMALAVRLITTMEIIADAPLRFCVAL